MGSYSFGKVMIITTTLPLVRKTGEEKFPGKCLAHRLDTDLDFKVEGIFFLKTQISYEKKRKKQKICEVTIPTSCLAHVLSIAHLLVLTTLALF